jgi:GTP-binding protein
VHFVDEATIRVKAGAGGNGAIAFRREKFVPKGGPSGGDGGDGASVIMVVDEGLSTLLDFRYRHEFDAPSGANGANKDKYGRGGEDVVLRVPPGTQVFDDATGALIGDLRTHGERLVVAQGGKGGRGNIHFATSTDRAPRKSEPGTPGEERTVRLELKLLADVGLLGFPNVGKSSLIARISAARPKIADYPFTTLVPNLGTVGLSGERSFVVADIPGLIEGAHAGAGLGDRFLRHLDRTRLLVHLLDATAVGRTPLRDYETMNKELALYDAALAARPQLVVLNKIDLPEVRKRGLDEGRLAGPLGGRLQRRCGSFRAPEQAYARVSSLKACVLWLDPSPRAPAPAHGRREAARRLAGARASLRVARRCPAPPPEAAPRRRAGHARAATRRARAARRRDGREARGREGRLRPR